MTPSEERARLQEELREEIDKLGRLADDWSKQNDDFLREVGR